MDTPRPIIILPSQSTSFIGREAEIAEISTLLADPACRLLTLTGLGGIGKTRLAIAVAQQMQEAFPDGIYFVPLQPLQQSDQILPAILNVLNLKAVQNPQADLLAYLAHKQLLLILDNFEHLLDGVDLLANILNATSRVKILTTSREALRLQEEWLRQIHGLDYPDGMTSSAVNQFSAVQLFIERAKRLRGDLDFDAQHEHVIQIIQLVEGMPLALELAAGWIKTLTCEEIAAELRHNPGILEAQTLNTLDRHRSMQNVFDHSWQLLGADELVVLQQLSVFRGGCTREAAEQVAGATLDLLSALVEKSLLRHDPQSGRYDFHELLRQYAAEQLDKTPDQTTSVLNRHCDYFAGLLHQREKTIHLSDQSDILIELDNLRVAWVYAVEQWNLDALLRAAPSLNWLYHFQSWHDEGAAIFYMAEEALQSMPTTDDSRFLLGMIRLFRGWFAREQPKQIDYPPVDIKSTLALWDDLDERPEMGLPLTRAMLMSMYNCNESSDITAIAQKSLAFSKRHNDLSGEAIALTSLGAVAYSALGKFSEAEELLEEGLTIDRRIGFDLNARWVERILGRIAYLEGQYADAKKHFEASLVYHKAGNIRKNLDTALLFAGTAALECGEDAAAKMYFEEGIKLSSDQQANHVIAKGHASLGRLAAFQGDSAAAEAHYADSQAYLHSLNLGLTYDLGPESLGFLALLLGHYPYGLAFYEDHLSFYEDTGYRVPLMCVHSRMGQALLGLRDEDQAKPHLFEALREASDIGAWQILLEALFGIAQLSTVPKEVAVQLLALVCEHPAANRYSRTKAKQILDHLEDALPSDNFQAAVENGRTLTLEAATALAQTWDMDSKLTSPTHQQPLADPLSQRELEVLGLIAEGHTNQEIADQLYIGVSTVKKHINHIYSKLDVTHRAQAVATARSLNIIS